MNEKSKEIIKSFEFEDALESCGFGKYNILMLATNCCLIVAMYLDIFGFSVILPAVACDLQLSTAQQGLLSALPLVGIMLSSYAWGLCADTLGRRRTLLTAMPVGSLLNLAAAIAPTYASLATLKCLSAAFTSSANAAGFVLVGEFTPARHRNRFMFLMASCTMFVQGIISTLSFPIFTLSFRIYIPWLALEYRPWRLLMHVICAPGIIGIFCIFLLHESPKFLMSKGRKEEALEVLKNIHRCNNGPLIKEYVVEDVYLEKSSVSAIQADNTPFIKKMWHQTAPLFKPPLLKNSLKIYYILLTAFMTSTGFTMWVPTMTNAYFNAGDISQKTFCEVASQAATSKNTIYSDCDTVIHTKTLYATLCYSVSCGVLNLLLTLLVGPLGKKKTTILVMMISATCGLLLLFMRIPILSIIFFYLFLYVAIILGNMNTYLVELNPTHLRGMATCLSVVVARGFGFVSVQLIAGLLAHNCQPMIGGYIVLVLSGLFVAFFLPQENEKKESHVTPRQNTDPEIDKTRY